MSNKTNVQILRELLTKGQEERLEFLEAVEDDLMKSRDEIIDLQKEIESLKDDKSDEDQEGMGYSNSIDTGMESLEWSCPNLGIQSLMETFSDKLSQYGHIKLESFLKSL